VTGAALSPVTRQASPEPVCMSVGELPLAILAAVDLRHTQNVASRLPVNRRLRNGGTRTLSAAPASTDARSTARRRPRRATHSIRTAAASISTATEADAGTA